MLYIVVSQFTLLASTKKGNKPDFHKSAGPNVAKELYDRFFSKVQTLYKPEKVKDGVFQAMMDVALINDGPVGVDYCCEDGVVNISQLWEPSHSRSRELTGHIQVTIEIDTNPPKMPDPTNLDLPADSGTMKGKIQKQFTLPASLLD